MRLLTTLAAALLSAAPAFAAPFSSDRISVTTQGKGRDVILIHGLSSNARIWDSTIAGVPGYRYHKVQVFGFGGAPNKGNTSDPVVPPIADEIARYVKEQQLTAPAIVGHSMGGTIGMTLAVRHPEAVGRLMIVDMFPFMGAMFGGPSATPASLKPMADQLFTGMKNPTPEGEAMATQMISSMVNTEAMRAQVLTESRASDRDLSARAYRELILTDLRPELSKITVPTTVLYAVPKGMPITPEQLDQFYKASYAGIAGVTITRIPDSAHFIMFDAPARFQQELKAFLG